MPALNSAMMVRYAVVIPGNSERMRLARDGWSLSRARQTEGGVVREMNALASGNLRRVARDIVCGAPIDLTAGQVRLKQTWRGEEFWFCSQACAARFDAAPARYVPATLSAAELFSNSPGSRLLRLPFGERARGSSGDMDRPFRDVAGVEPVIINLTARTVVLLYDPSQAGAGEVVAALRASGFTVPVMTARLGIEGLYCPACMLLVERELEALPGVIAATVGPQRGEATVIYQPQSVSPGKLEEVVARAGYRPHEVA